MFTELKQIPEAWRRAFSSRSFRNQLWLSMLLVLVVSLHNFHCLRIWQARPGIQLNDLLLNLFPPMDFSGFIFFIEYFSLILVFIFLLPYPEKLVKGFQVFSVITGLRTICIYFVLLEPPRDMIPLYDPVAVFLVHSPDIFVTKDLFFSGHVATLVMLMLISPNKYIKWWSLAASVMVGILLLSQHVHYSLDILFAPVAAFISYKLVLFFHRQTRFGLELQSQEQP